MKARALAAACLVGAFAVAISGSAFAQSTLGGAKPQQNKIGGVAKPAPVVGGATIHTPQPPTPPKPAPILATKPPSPGGTPAPGSLGAVTSATTANNSRPNPPVTPPANKGGKVANLKCASGACTVRGGKP